jgi:hypothetical protein
MERGLPRIGRMSADRMSFESESDKGKRTLRPAATIPLLSAKTRTIRVRPRSILRRGPLWQQRWPKANRSCGRGLSAVRNLRGCRRREYPKQSCRRPLWPRAFHPNAGAASTVSVECKAQVASRVGLILSSVGRRSSPMRTAMPWSMGEARIQ